MKVGLRAKAAGMSVSLNLHYSDTWADPGHQAAPVAWAKMNIDQVISQSQTDNLSGCQMVE